MGPYAQRGSDGDRASTGVKARIYSIDFETQLEGFDEAFDVALSALARDECRKHFNLSGRGMDPTHALKAARFGGTNPLTIMGDADERFAGSASALGRAVRSTDSFAYSPGFLWTNGSININVTNWNKSYVTAANRAGTLIHELGHLYDMVAGLGGSDFKHDLNLKTGKADDAAQAFNAGLEKDCLK